MSFVRGFLKHPQRVWFRRLNFQLHLWIGLILTLYLLMIGFTGSILVFREELEAMAGFNQWHNLEVSGPPADPAAIVATLRAAYPAARLTVLTAPTHNNPVFLASVQSPVRTLGSSRIAIHPVTGQILGRSGRRAPAGWAWLGTVRNLHITLLSGVTGRQVNAVLAGCLLLINLTGMVIWWPGIRSWTRALMVDFRRTWRRVNFDLHSAAGFWTLVLVSFWAISGVYFGFSSQTLELVDRISPIVSARPPAVRVDPEQVDAPPDLRMILNDALQRDPGATLREIVFPSGRRAPLEISLQRPGTRGAEFADTIYFNPYDGSYITTWRYGVNQSFGDLFIWSQIPLHFGTFWGVGVKIVWAALSLSIPILCITGALMYWNRFLRKKWKRFPMKTLPAPSTQ